jgi:hypothetical protein
MTRRCVPSYSGATVTSSPEEMPQNIPVQRLKGGNFTTGLPSDRLVTQPRELSIIFSDCVPRCVPQCVIIQPNTTIEMWCISLLLRTTNTANILDLYSCVLVFFYALLILLIYYIYIVVY